MNLARLVTWDQSVLGDRHLRSDAHLVLSSTSHSPDILSNLLLLYSTSLYSKHWSERFRVLQRLTFNSHDRFSLVFRYSVQLHSTTEVVWSQTARPRRPRVGSASCLNSSTRGFCITESSLILSFVSHSRWSSITPRVAQQPAIKQEERHNPTRGLCRNVVVV